MNKASHQPISHCHPGKGNEDKRGQAVDPKVSHHSWLYVGGKPVVCSRYTEVAALVSSINPSISATTDSLEVASLQQSLLWLLNDGDHLAKYPMALGTPLKSKLITNNFQAFLKICPGITLHRDLSRYNNC